MNTTSSYPTRIFINDTLTLELFSKKNAGQYFHLIRKNKSQLENSFRMVLQELLKSNPEDYMELLLKVQDAAQRYIWLIRQSNPDPCYVGAVSIHKIDRLTSKCRLGYFIDKQAGGQGYGSLSVKVVTQHCFDTLKMNKVMLRIIPSNTASVKIAEKTGYKKAGLVRQEILSFNGTLKDALYYELLKTEFKP